MSLSKNDLNQIRVIVQETVEPLRQDITSMQKGQKSLQTGQDSLFAGQEQLITRYEQLAAGQKRLEKKLTAEIRGLRKIINIVIDTFDRQNIALAKRVTRIENHLQI